MEGPAPALGVDQVAVLVVGAAPEPADLALGAVLAPGLDVDMAVAADRKPPIQAARPNLNFDIRTLSLFVSGSGERGLAAFIRAGSRWAEARCYCSRSLE